MDFINANELPNCLRGRFCISSEHNNTDIGFMKSLNRINSCRFDGVCNADETGRLPVHGDKHDSLAL